MLISANLLNARATLNDYFQVKSVSYVPGTKFSLKFQIIDVESGNRVMPTSGALVNVIFYKNDATQLTLAASMMFPSDDRSMWSVDVSASNSLLVNGGNVIITLDPVGDASEVDKGMLYQVLKQVLFDGDC